MRYKNAFLITRKSLSRSGNDELSESGDLIHRAGLVHQVASGHFSYLPIGIKILRKIEKVVREEMQNASALETLMPIMQPSELWKQSGRWDVYGDEMFKIENRSGREFCLGPTHEELVVNLAKAQIESYRDLPVTLFQVATKFRDEKRPRGGLIRCKEFLMKDAYSFDLSSDGLDQSYQKMRAAYFRIMTRLQVDVVTVSADSGEIGGGFSEEFLAASPDGEDAFYMDLTGEARKIEDYDADEQVEKSTVKSAIEIGHIFKLGTKYSSAMGLTCADKSGNIAPLLMGCYGIGLSRLLPTIASHNHDEKGIIWPSDVTPFDFSILSVPNRNIEIEKIANELYSNSQRRQLDVLLDDREVSVGVKFNDHDAIGVPRKVIVGPRGIENGYVEVELRADRSKHEVSIDTIRNNPRIVMEIS